MSHQIAQTQLEITNRPKLEINISVEFTSKYNYIFHVNSVVYSNSLVSNKV